MPDSDIEIRGRQEANHLFSSAGAAVQGLRLRIEKRVVVPLDDLFAALQESRRKLEDRKYREAYDRYDQFYGQFGERIGQWERKAEGQLQAIKDSHKPGKLEQLKTEIADVRAQSQSALRLLSRLRSALEPLSKLPDASEGEPTVVRTSEKSKPIRRARVVDESLLDFPEDEGMPLGPAAEVVSPPQAASESLASAAPGFLEAFKAADSGGRLAVVRQFFDVECEPQMEMVQTAERRMTVTFSPPLEVGRYYFLLGAGRILRIDGVGKALAVYDPERNQPESMPLKDLVRHAQGGVWLLRLQVGEITGGRPSDAP